jgi:hypothetical protein
MRTAGDGLYLPQEESAVIGEFLFGDGVGNHDHEPARFGDFDHVGICGQGRGHEFRPTFANGVLGRSLFAEMVFIDDRLNDIGSVVSTPRKSPMSSSASLLNRGELG